MQFNKGSGFHLTVKILTLVILIITLRTDASPTVISDETLNAASDDNDTTIQTSSSTDHPSGDSYFDETHAECITGRHTSACVRYEVLKYIHELVSPYAETEGRSNEIRPELQVWGPIKIIPLLPNDIPTNLPNLFSELDSKSTDSEIVRIFRFTMREIERFLSSYALAINIPTASSSGRSTEYFATPKFIDDNFFSGSFTEGKNIDINITEAIYAVLSAVSTDLPWKVIYSFADTYLATFRRKLLPFSSA
jgi:hypothetical protein